MAAGPLAAGSLAAARPASAGGTAVEATNLELVTLTEDQATITWYTGAAGSQDDLGRTEPAPADGEVRWGTSPDRLDQVAGDLGGETPYHHVVLDGLEPDRTYYYEARSGGAVATPTPFTITDGNPVGTDQASLDGGGPFAFTVPQPPPGRFLFSVVLCNDLHMGETEAGLVGGLPQITGVTQQPGLPPYPEVMLESLVADASALGATYLLAAGDITAEAEPIDLRRTTELLDGFGSHGQEWFVARGNHDRAHDGEAWSSCRVGAWGGHDCFVDEFFADDEPTWFQRDLHGLRVIGIDTYDKAGSGGDAGELAAEQMSWFRSTLTADQDQPTIVFGHHPLTVVDSPFPTTAGSALDAEQASSIVETYAEVPGVFLHHAGHTHRNKRTELTGAPGVLHQEVAAVKEYPGGFTLLRIHEGGYALNFHKSSSDLARAWSERSRMQILGTWPQFSLGAQVADRNVVVERDLSGISAPPRADGLPASGPARGEPSRGADRLALGIGGTAVLAGVGAAVAWRRRPAG